MTQPSDDLAALWGAVFGEPPPMRADPALVCDLMVRYLPLAPPYVPGAAPAKGGLASAMPLVQPAENLPEELPHV